MKTVHPINHKKAFITAFDSLLRRHNRHQVFRDFVTMSAISLHNAIAKSDEPDAEYFGIIKRYEKDERILFPELLGHSIDMLEPEPQDVLGPLYMELELGNAKSGQLFTPAKISELMVQLLHGDKLKDKKQPCIKFSEPCCGSGSMTLAFVKQMLAQDLNPATNIWVYCIDIDRTVAQMCYIQLTLWNVPTQVIVGDILTLEYREQFSTFAHHASSWEARLHFEEVASLITKTFESVNEPDSQESAPTENKRIEAGKFEQISLF